MLTAQHRFLDVRLLEAIDGITAGTVGVLVDFFPTYTIVELFDRDDDQNLIFVAPGQLEPVADQAAPAA